MENWHHCVRTTFTWITPIVTPDPIIRPALSCTDVWKTTLHPCLLFSCTISLLHSFSAFSSSCLSSPQQESGKCLSGSPFDLLYNYKWTGLRTSWMLTHSEFSQSFRSEFPQHLNMIWIVSAEIKALKSIGDFIANQNDLQMTFPNEP